MQLLSVSKGETITAWIARPSWSGFENTHLRSGSQVSRISACSVRLLRHDSDVDVMVDFHPSARVTLGRLQCDLSKLLGVSVDISFEVRMHEPVRKQALSEARLVF